MRFVQPPVSEGPSFSRLVDRHMSCRGSRRLSSHLAILKALRWYFTCPNLATSCTTKPKRDMFQHQTPIAKQAVAQESASQPQPTMKLWNKTFLTRTKQHQIPCLKHLVPHKLPSTTKNSNPTQQRSLNNPLIPTHPNKLHNASHQQSPRCPLYTISHFHLPQHILQ